MTSWGVVKTLLVRLALYHHIIFTSDYTSEAGSLANLICLIRQAVIRCCWRSSRSRRHSTGQSHRCCRRGTNNRTRGGSYTTTCFCSPSHCFSSVGFTVFSGSWCDLLTEAQSCIASFSSGVDLTGNSRMASRNRVWNWRVSQTPMYVYTHTYFLSLSLSLNTYTHTHTLVCVHRIYIRMYGCVDAYMYGVYIRMG
jgi:hypothetical protein